MATSANRSETVSAPRPVTLDLTESVGRSAIWVTLATYSQERGARNTSAIPTMAIAKERVAVPV